MYLHITGTFQKTVSEKTIMLVGATGSGKSTLVDGIVNYVMGVSFDDPYRFTLIQLEKEENKMENQVQLLNNDHFNFNQIEFNRHSNSNHCDINLDIYYYVAHINRIFILYIVLN